MLVCGLDVPWNLALLQATSKGVKQHGFSVEDAAAAATLADARAARDKDLESLLNARAEEALRRAAAAAERERTV